MLGKVQLKTQSRIASIVKAISLDSSITGLQTFNLSALKIERDLRFELPTNLRLGHLAERIVGELIKSSSNYKLRYENVQIIENGKTIGEIDFVLEDEISKQLIHLELAYKFYCYDPSISSASIDNWIGPNRNDSLTEKLEKLKRKQFPLLYRDCAKNAFAAIKLDEVSQALCLLVSLYIPYEYKGTFDPAYEKAIKGYYLSIETFKQLDHAHKRYYLPAKTEWGMDPAENEHWTDDKGIETKLEVSIEEKKAPLCWQECEGVYSTFFIVWW